jgi:flagellar hook protein FlgE
MFSSLNTAASALQQFQQEIDVIGNNMANVNTTGFKDATMNFEDTFSQALGLGGSSVNQIGTGVQTGSIANNFTQGNLANTGVPSDLGISGQGFFVVRAANNGAQYVTRAGNFHVDASGYLVTDNGMRVQGLSDSGLTTLGDIKIDATGAPATAAAGATVQSYTIAQNGDLDVTLSDGTQFVRGQVLLQSFTNPNALAKQGDNLFSATAAAGGLAQAVAPQTNGLGSIQAGALEMSNVDLTTQMTDLITAERAFESNAKIVTTSDEILQDLVNLKR